MGKPRKTLGDYLSETEPITSLWRDLLDEVYRNNPRQARVERLSHPARVLYDTGCFFGEIVNGGISQFFSNSSGNRTHETLAALREIDAALCVELLEKALTLFPNNVAPVDRSARCELLFAFTNTNPKFLEELDIIFYKRVDSLGDTPEEDLDALRLAFLRAHHSYPVVVSLTKNTPTRPRK